MKKRTFKILFIGRSARTNKRGEMPVFLRVTVDGQRAETSINIFVNAKKWNALAERVIGDSPEDSEINLRFESIRMQILQIYREMEYDRKEITPRSIIDRFIGRDQRPEIMLLDVFREHNERCRKLEGKDMATATVTRYETSLRHTENFVQFAYKREDIPITEVNHKFITDYEFYLKTERNCAHNSAMKYLKNFKKIIRLALASEYITKDPFANIKFKYEEIEQDFLEDTEIQRIIDKAMYDSPVGDRSGYICFSMLYRIELFRRKGVTHGTYRYRR